MAHALGRNKNKTVAPPGQQAASLSKTPLHGAAGIQAQRKLSTVHLSENGTISSNSGIIGGNSCAIIKNGGVINSNGGGGGSGIGFGGGEEGGFGSSGGYDAENGNRFGQGTTAASRSFPFERAGCHGVTTMTSAETVEVDGDEVRPSIRYVAVSLISGLRCLCKTCGLIARMFNYIKRSLT